MAHGPTTLQSDRSQEFIDTAIALSDAVAGGADPADPDVVALLNSIAEDFGVDINVGTNGHDFLFAPREALTYTNALGGNDIIFGRAGTDVIVGGDGEDIAFGRAGDDALFGGGGDDTLFGQRGDDVLRGGEGDDDLFGGRGDDTLEGGADDDALFGRRGEDLLDGGAGDDFLAGGSKADTLIGGEGEDVLRGGNGVDTLEGGLGDDLLVGGKHADSFLFDPSNPDLGDDRIRDFELGVDQIVLEAVDILASAPGIEGADGLQPSDLDEDDRWDLVASHDHDLVVIHPGGTIEIDTVAFDPGLTFDALVDLGAVAVI